jgi:hypothetical protein
MDAGRTLAGLRRGRLPVFCSDDERPVGRVDGWLASPEQGRQLLVRSGWWSSTVRRVAQSDVASLESRVLLRLDLEHFLKQPLYVPDDELGLAAYEALWTDVPLRYAALRFIEIQVRDGVIRLSGHVANDARRRLAVRRVSATPGVLRVKDDLVTDEQVVTGVALAMLPHRELQPSRVRISADAGRVILEGELESPRDIELAIAVAASVPGVASVESRLRARPRPGPLRPPGPSQAPRLVMIVPGEPCPPSRYVR